MFNGAASRLVAAALFFVFVLPFSLFAQSLPVFRAGTTLVDFTIVAVDERGNPVTDLRKDELSILEDGAVRELAFFRFEGATGGSVPNSAVAPLSSGNFSNRTAYAPDAPHHLVAVVLDFVNASLVEQFELRAQFLQYLRQIPADARVGLYVVRDNAVAVHDFTQDAGSVRARLENGELDVYGRALAGIDLQKILAEARPEQRSSLAALAQANTRGVQEFNLQIARERRQKTLSALDSVGGHLAGLSGRKSLVWVSQGFPLTSQLEASFVDEVRDASRRLASQGVVVYPVDAGGLKVDRENPISRGRIEATSEVMASITGGRTARNSNELTRGLAAAGQDLRGTYAVGFYASTGLDNQWHPLTVRVSRPGVVVRHREGYYAASTPHNLIQAWSEGRWNELANRPLISTAVRIDARPALASGTLQLVLNVASDDLQFRQRASGVTADVDIALVEKGAQGPMNLRVQSASVERPQGGGSPDVTFRTGLTLNLQTGSVRIIVRDKSTDRFGSLDIPIAAVHSQWKE